MTSHPLPLSPGQVIEEEPEAPEDEGWKANFNIHMICPECREFPPRLVEEYSNGDTVCASCGLVLQSHIIDTRSEWRTFNNDDGKGDDPSRVGAAPDAIHDDVPLMSEISRVDVKGSSIGILRAHGLVNAKNKKANHQEVYDRIGAFAAAAHLTSTVAETAITLFKDAHNDKLFRSKSQDALIAGCLFLASRHHQTPRTFKDFHRITQVPKKDIGTLFKALDTFFLKLNAKKKTKVVGGMVMQTQNMQETQYTGAHGVCINYASRMGLTRATQSLSVLIAQKVDQTGVLSGRSPVSISGACIYAASHLMGEGRTYREIGIVMEAGDSTIKTAYKDIYANRAALIDEEWLKAHGKDMSGLPSS